MPSRDRARRLTLFAVGFVGLTFPGVARATAETSSPPCRSCRAEPKLAASSDAPPVAGNTVTGQVRITKFESDQAREDRADVVVFLEQAGGAASVAPIEGITISQKRQRFSPRVTVVTRGTRIRFPNDDVVFHNVFSLSKASPFDLGVYARGEVKSVRFPKSGLVKVYCNIHPEMVSNILVLNSRHFAVTQSDGRFVIEGVKDGSYTLRTWHELGGETSQEVTLSGGTSHDVPIHIRETVRTIEHNDKFGRPYRGKYK